ncbi:flagellar biosynthesis anti-sigma factor FlgM [Rhodanobacter sp. T12-5]|jgi:negative regulator of flagellin synthesis FlgM|uniref:flagellar biosynthesis anti-sigma factor FlgM n=1 Tax=Rhodanobacter sp. T12-5 TaxID=2024611 RepID=UPI0011EE8951|nr:flagellar biosynthesis anti-sigma factor FlgM [Rhodanobacter sp. T12-5]KAA0072256.1 flagellar biosynthesis anti-sigma factor FlgM [Rhodanobacter sp. T12-5]HTH68842.1 flagellar biosynthesis anti-sigma factor FlgM [Rhodanobacter sp.]
MNTTISNSGLPKFTQATNNPGNGSAAASTTSTASGAAASKPDDQLKLTDSALALQEAAKPGDAAVIDQSRVDQIRQSLADGSYKVNPGNIADRMIALDQQFGGVAKA